MQVDKIEAVSICNQRGLRFGFVDVDGDVVGYADGNIYRITPKGNDLPLLCLIGGSIE